MILWSHHNKYPATNRRDTPTIPLLDCLVLLVMVLAGVMGYRAVRSAHEMERASSGNLRAAVVVSCAGQTLGGTR